MKKKLIIIFSLLFLCGSCFALPEFEIEELPAIDQPFVRAFNDFSSIFINFQDYAKKIGILCAFLCIIFNAFKLWSSTAEIKKVYVDSIYKAVMFSAVLFLYPLLVENVLALSCKIGITASGGQHNLNLAFSELGMKMKSNYDKTMNEVLKLMTEGQVEGKNNYLSDETYQNLYAMGKSEEEIKQWAEQNGFEMIFKNEQTINGRDGYTRTEVYYTDKDGNIVKQSLTNGVYSSWKQKQAQKKANKVLNGNNVTITDSNGEKKVISGKALNQSLTMLRGMLQVTTGIDEEELKNSDGKIDTNKLLNEAMNSLDKIFYSPYLNDKDKTPTYILSMSRMIKTGIIVAEICSFGVSHYYDEKKGQFVEIKLSEEKGGVVFGSIMRLIKYLFYWLGILLAMILILCEYAMTILEYRIITSMAIILLPLLFLDATKQYAQNILRIFLQYFFKIMVIMVCCFFTLSMFLRLGVDMLTKTDLQATSTFCLYLFTLIFGTLLTLNSGKIASTLISGNPTMGLGELIHMGHDMSHIAQMGQRGLHNAVNAGKTVGKATAQGVQAAVRGGMNVASTLDAAGQAASRTREGLTGATGYTGKEKDIERAARCASRATIAGAFKQSIGDKAYKAFTGLDREHLDEKLNSNAFVKAGQNIYTEGRERKVTVEDVKKQNTSMADKFADSAIENSKNIHNAQADADRKKKKNMPEIEK